ncbi:hypothetical protein NK983_23915, partial [Salmonella enterica subsp. enterica serovar Typhimurium]|nr:hypothetical protein [Salmonella enterica subsp. enterica serovar Typhimurium]
MSGIEAPPADATPHRRSHRLSATSWQAIALGFFVLMISLGLASLSARGDLRAVHAELAHTLMAPLQARQTPELRRILSDAHDRGLLTEASLRDAKGELLVDLPPS